MTGVSFDVPEHLPDASVLMTAAYSLLGIPDTRGSHRDIIYPIPQQPRMLYIMVIRVHLDSCQRSGTFTLGPTVLQELHLLQPSHEVAQYQIFSKHQ